ncbi:AI-2E family transporter [Bacillus sp. 31A1R]|uniref:AI-2E family transporter n=1 Tax=Robertmurraya mangrovi TaxID=3098077 RepID=A0ABU5J2U9_9BACI|nr:AI-2E family transporter [Bacillus sp. 31A1R]MDZ5473745.1 AI-2E family transporter [Bacillus sp. 31A1R]
MSLINKKWFTAMIGIILFLIIVYLLRLNLIIFTPLYVLIHTIFLPFVIAGILFYLCRPLVKWLEGKKVPKWIAILSAYLAITLIIYVLVKMVGPVISDQLQRFVDNLPAMVSTVTDWIKYFQMNRATFPDFIQEALLTASQDFETRIQDNVGNIANGILGVFGFIGGVVNTIFYLVLVPIILFYMLKDSDHFAPRVVSFFKKSKQDNVRGILKDMDKTISSYIQGQMLVSFIVGALLYIGYLIIDLNYSLVLALFAMLMNVIPFVGPFLAVVPAILVALFQDPIMVLYVAIITLIAQQIEGNLVSPQVMGKTLNIHPLTIIVLILTAGNLMGLVGIIFIIPAYSIAKVLVTHTVKIYKINQE